MSQELTLKVAQKFLKNNDAVDLSEFISIADAAAEALAKHKGWLDLSGLKTLSDAAAKALAKLKGNLDLSGLTSLSDGAAAAFARHEGDLSLRGLTTLSDATVTTLSQQKGRLGLDGLKSLSGAAAVALANHEGDLSFEGLEILTDEAAAALSKHEGGLRLISLTELSEAAAASLAMHNGEVVLNGQAEAAYRAAKLKGVPKLKWDPDFLKGVKARWKKSLGIDGFTSAEQLLATLTSQGTSPKEIVACMEANDMCMGGDSACERAVKVGWLTGAWDVSWTTFQEAMESQSPDEMAQQAAELIADAVLGDNAK